MGAAALAEALQIPPDQAALVASGGGGADLRDVLLFLYIQSYKLLVPRPHKDSPQSPTSRPPPPRLTATFPSSPRSSSRQAEERLQWRAPVEGGVPSEEEARLEYVRRLLVCVNSPPSTRWSALYMALIAVARPRHHSGASMTTSTTSLLLVASSLTYPQALSDNNGWTSEWR